MYEANRKRVVVFGGIASGQYVAETWEWDGVQWSARVPVLSPGPLADVAASYDAIRGQVVIFGGHQAANLDGTWTYQFATPGAPSELCQDASEDTDQDGLAGCADPDCWGRCNPLCPPGAPCSPDAPLRRRRGARASRIT